MDLKPKNVLVFDGDLSSNTTGGWKLTGFDVSSISEVARRKPDQHYTVTVSTKAKQTPSACQGPELPSSVSGKLKLPFTNPAG